MATETYFLEHCPACGEPAAMIMSAAGSFYARCNNVRCKFDRFARTSLTRREAAMQWNNICRRYIESSVEEAKRCPVCGGRAIVVNAIKDSVVWDILEDERRGFGTIIMCGNARCNSTIHSFSEDSVDIAIQKWNEMFIPKYSSDLTPITHEEFISFLGGE